MGDAKTQDKEQIESQKGLLVKIMDHKFQQNFDILMDKREFDFKSVISLSGLDGLDQSLMSMAVI